MIKYKQTRILELSTFITALHFTMIKYKQNLLMKTLFI